MRHIFVPIACILLYGCGANAMADQYLMVQRAMNESRRYSICRAANVSPDTQAFQACMSGNAFQDQN
ncbi:MAG: hypothetical protein GC166_06970 [Alphaproteobacteria bacterium]|nr:hypothetical protein [Alphaproteobacteria bacterium]